MASAQQLRRLPKGIYTPIPTFFHKDEELDLESLAKHVTSTAFQGTVPVLAGTAGEAPHLTASERVALITTARKALDATGLTDTPIISGVSAPSTRQTIALTRDAVRAGVDGVMVIPPGYYASYFASATGKEALKEYFVEVAAASDVPVLLYNFPGVAGGIDLDSDTIIDIVREAPNIVGVKLTCANVGKLTRISFAVTSGAFRKTYPRRWPHQEFLAIDGFIDILLPSAAVGASGAISVLSNFAPRTCVKLWGLCQAPSRSPESEEARRLQGLIAEADEQARRMGIDGMKAVLGRTFGYPIWPRRPFLPVAEEKVESIMANERMMALFDEETKLAK